MLKFSQNALYCSHGTRAQKNQQPLSFLVFVQQTHTHKSAQYTIKNGWELKGLTNLPQSSLHISFYEYSSRGMKPNAPFFFLCWANPTSLQPFLLFFLGSVTHFNKMVCSINWETQTSFLNTLTIKKLKKFWWPCPSRLMSHLSRTQVSKGQNLYLMNFTWVSFRQARGEFS